MPLTDTRIRRIKPSGKTVRLFDERGLYLEVSPRGGKWWRLKYRFKGKEKRLSFGVYPDVNLKNARFRRDEARKLLANGVDPSENRKAQKAARADRVANSFERVAREWFSKYSNVWAPTHANKIIQRLNTNIFPWIGGKPIAEVSAPELLNILRQIEGRGALDTAHRALQNCSQIFRYGIATGRCDRDPAIDLRGALPPARHEHFAAITEPTEVGELLRAIDGFRGTLVVQSALRLAPLLFVRPGELRKAQWRQFDFEKRDWRYYVAKTKREHLVPLATQAVAVLKTLHPLTGTGVFVFPGRDPKKPMSDAALNAALRRLGYDTKTEITSHGFRAMARTILHQELGIKPEVIEHQLAHRVPDILGAAYNRTKFLKERQIMMQQWADYLDRLKTSSNIVLLRQHR
jgi:integrase